MSLVCMWFDAILLIVIVIPVCIRDSYYATGLKILFDLFSLLWMTTKSVQYPKFVPIFNQLISVHTFNVIIMLLYCSLVCIFVSVQVPIYHYFLRYNQERLDLLNQRTFWNENYTINSKFQLIANLYVLKVIPKMLIVWVF